MLVILLLEKITQSLAGRLAVCKPMTLGLTELINAHLLIFCSATEIAGGLDTAMPHQAAVIKLGFSPTIAPINTAGIG